MKKFNCFFVLFAVLLLPAGCAGTEERIAWYYFTKAFPPHTAIRPWPASRIRPAWQRRAGGGSVEVHFRMK